MGGKRPAALLLVLALLLTGGLLSVAGRGVVSAEPDRHEWSVVDTPSEEGFVVVSPSEVNALVLASGETFYAIDIPNREVYRSIDGGVTWKDDMTQALLDEGAVLPAWDIAVAPGDPDLVAVVTDARQEVYVSEDGGETWEDTQLSSATGWDSYLLIADIDISPEYDGGRDMAVGTRKPDGSANGDVWVLKREIIPGWKAQDLEIDSTVGADVSSVCFSPDYDNDSSIVVVASDTIGTYLCTGFRDTTLDTTEWKVTVPASVEIKGPVGGSPTENEIIFSDLALPAGYSGDTAESRVLYAGYASNTAADDAFRIEDNKAFRLNIDMGDPVAVASIAYRDGRLLAGEVASKPGSASALLHVTFEPEENAPGWGSPEKPPTGGLTSGNANAQVALIEREDPESGEEQTYAYCGTSTNDVETATEWALPGNWIGQLRDESALSWSDEDCYVWNQLSLIDTDMAFLCDYALTLEDTGDGSEYDTLFLASAGAGYDSVWRSSTDPPGEVWERVWCFDSQSDEPILRLGPEDGSRTLFLAARDSDYARYSQDRGQTWQWFWRAFPENITDVAVVDDELLYVLDDNLVNRCAWDGDRGLWEWERDIETGLLSGYSIAVSGHDYVFVGDDGDEGEIAYSINGAESFQLIEAVPEPGKMQVCPDEEFSRNRIVYAASDDTVSGIYRWTIGGSTHWRELNPPHGGFVGLAQKSGVLYGAYGPGVDRTLVPHLNIVKEYDWDSLTVDLAAGATFRPTTLRAVSDEAVDLWAIDDRGYDFAADKGCLWTYSDAFALQTPWPTIPAIGEGISCDPCGCDASTFCFSWRRLPSAERYDLWIAIDEKFDHVIARIEDIVLDDCCNPSWCTDEDPLRFVCGETYYWKVRSASTVEGETVHSRWSPAMKFVVEAGTTREGMHTAPLLTAPENGGVEISRSPAFTWVGFPDTMVYEFILAEDSGLTQVVVSEKLSHPAYMYEGQLGWGKTYFWRVRALEPAPSDATTGTFTVMLQPQPGPGPMPGPPEVVLPAQQTPRWVWIVIGVLGLLAALVVVLCITSGRRGR